MRLNEYARINRLRQQDLADQLGVTQATVSRLMSNKIAPSLKMAQKVEILTSGQVRAQDWYADQ